MCKKCAVSCLALFFVIAVSGCASYYKITDPASGKVYYTEDIDKKSSGIIEFKDEATKAQVTLPTSEVMEITEDQYNANIHPK
jgi:uncharacterized protein YceK